MSKQEQRDEFAQAQGYDDWAEYVESGAAENYRLGLEVDRQAKEQENQTTRG